jgi:hypothetical protein
MDKTQISKIASPVIAAFTAAEKAQVKVGDAVLAASTKLAEKDIKPFCDAIKASLENRGFTPGSVKTTVSYIRRVLAAIIVDGFEPEPGQTLRGLYESLPKKVTGGAAHAPRLPNPAAASDETPKEVTVSTTAEEKAERFKAAITDIFGHCDADLIEAMQYVAANEPVFIRWAQASMKAAMLAEVEKAVTPAKRTRKPKQVATA